MNRQTGMKKSLAAILLVTASLFGGFTQIAVLLTNMR
jgi:hypothetical protein